MIGMVRCSLTYVNSAPAAESAIGIEAPPPSAGPSSPAPRPSSTIRLGFAYEIGLASLPKGFRGILPAKKDYNGPFFLAGRGLARCLIARGQRAEGREVLNHLAKFDPREETIRGLLTELDQTAGE